MFGKDTQYQWSITMVVTEELDSFLSLLCFPEIEEVDYRCDGLKILFCSLFAFYFASFYSFSILRAIIYSYLFFLFSSLSSFFCFLYSRSCARFYALILFYYILFCLAIYLYSFLFSISSLFFFLSSISFCFYSYLFCLLY